MPEHRRPAIAAGQQLVRRSETPHALSVALAPWRPRLAVHDPAKVLLDLALGLAVGGDCLADVAVLRAEPGVFGLVASDPTVSRTIDRLADDVTAVLAAIDTARAAARARAWKLAGDRAPDHGIDAGRPLVIDVDATLVTAHSEKEGAAPTFKKGFGHHPLWAFVDHGPAGTGEPVAALLRPGNAGSNTAADHLTVIRVALRQLPGHRTGHRPGRKILIRIDGAGATHELLDWLHTQRLSYSVGFGLTQQLVDQLAALPTGDWQTAYNADGEPRPGAWVIEATGLMSLTGWPAGMRVIVRKERPHPGAQLRLTDPDGHRYTAFATNTRPGGPGRQLADLELRHRRRARAEDRIRAAKDTGLRNLPLHQLDQNRIWQAIVALACEITAWTQLLAFTEHPARQWEPKRLRLRIFSLPAQTARHARRVALHLPAHAPWAGLVLDGLDRLRALAVPG
jgi:Transposase DDE domain group 1